MKNILITGATGNVGMEVIKSLNELNHTFEIYAGVFNLEKDKLKLKDYKLNALHFDFTDVATYKPALDNCDIFFLLRPPQLSEVKKYFKPLIDLAVSCSVKHIVFLSVQGVEKSKIIPHHKIEKLIVESKIPYTFLRPAYFMQNFTTTLHTDLVKHYRIFLPAGKAKFTLIDVKDIGEVAAKILTETEKHLNKSYELTNHEKLSFGEMAEKLSKGLKTVIKYESPNLLKFFIVKRKEKMPIVLILVMIMLHYLPRFQKEPEITDWVNKLINVEPKTFDEFVFENKNLLSS
jgi:uncharacterized protein YbjT (DUF2867 family)